ncbi:MAG: redoxin domain-containing protein [Pirellulales bacterium]
MRVWLLHLGRPFQVAGRACLAAAFLGMASLPAAEPAPAADASTVEVPAPAYVTLQLARDPAVHAELGLDAGQVTAALAAVAEVDHSLWVLRDVPVPKCSDQLEDFRSKLRKRLEAVLSPEQSQRFDQLLMQARGSKALVAPDVRERLSLTDGQLEQLKAIVSEAKQGTLDSQNVVAVLSAEQRAVLASMFGKRFDLGRVTHVGCVAPQLRGVDAWINSEPLALSQLQGKVVVVHFWAFNCGNCVNNLPHYQAWFDKFSTSDVTIIGIHTPETATERDVDNLRANVKQHAIAYPVAVDGAAENWKAWGNHMWPSVYLIDRHGKVRAWWYGELNWQAARGEESMRKRIEELLLEK